MSTDTQMTIILSCLTAVSLFDQSGKYSISDSHLQCMGKETFLYDWGSEKLALQEVGNAYFQIGLEGRVLFLL